MLARGGCARAGHEVHVYEKNAKAGGLLRYGISDFKMEKNVIDRRLAQMQAEGVVFHYGKPVGGGAADAIDPAQLVGDYDAVALTGGAEAPRDLPNSGPRSRRHSLRDGFPAAAEIVAMATKSSKHRTSSRPERTWW